ncbi:TPA: polar amino acid ABC transporter ATP-binding protein, partial [Candidatus Poribacteria bacterium]|nr:polar amino acid ABC transporter ATP-binding protein [Candidatus Poribacteria bacterium]
MIETSALTKTFGNLVAVEDLTLEVKRGEVLGTGHWGKCSNA